MVKPGKMRMKCTHDNKYIAIADYVSGNLQEAEQLEFEAHLLECDECFENVKVLEKASLLIHVKGEKAFQPQPIFSELIDAVADFFEKIRTIHITVPHLKKKLVPIPVTFFALSVLSFLFYNFDSSGLVSDIPSDTRAMRSNQEFQDIDLKKTEYSLGLGFTYYNKTDYNSALESFNAVQHLLKIKSQTKEVMKLQFATQLGLGATKAALWKQQEYNYFGWLGLLTRTGSADWTLLEDAEKHLLAAQQISDSITIRQEDKIYVNQLLTTIQKKSKLQ
jgi:hypothetical protein